MLHRRGVKDKNSIFLLSSATVFFKRSILSVVASFWEEDDLSRIVYDDSFEPLVLIHAHSDACCQPKYTVNKVL